MKKLFFDYQIVRSDNLELITYKWVLKSWISHTIEAILISFIAVGLVLISYLLQ